MLRALISTAVTAILALAAAAPASAAPAYVPGEVLVKSGGETKAVEVEAGQTVKDTVTELRRDPDVAYAVPNYIARASFLPNDPSFRLQWNLNSQFGINAPAAWDLARASGVPGGKGVTDRIGR